MPVFVGKHFGFSLKGKRMAHPVPKIRIPEQQRDNLREFVQLQNGTVTAMREALEKAEPTISAEALTAQIAGSIDLDRDVLLGILRMLISLAFTAERYQFSLEQVVSGVTKSALREDTGLAPKYVEDFKERLRAFLSLEKSIGVSSRALNVMLENNHTFVSGRVVSDIRPIFSRDETLNPFAAAIIHNLRIEAHTDDGHTNHYFGLDGRDLRALRNVIDRAIRKEESLKRAVLESNMSYLEIGFEANNDD